ncbi:MAG TPA: DUF1566 domain-containing protein, partial [bacterium]|nr:DUF1566 domain-containing protein [bacterium]
VFVDGKKVGTAPGTFKVPMCSEEVVVKTKKGEFKQNLSLQEKKVSKIDTILKPLSGNWSKIAPKEMSWDNAIKYCENLKEDDYSDWRLPTISELRTLIQNCPATETGGACKVTDSCLSWDDCRNDACDGCKYFEDGRYSKLGDTGWFWSSSLRSDDAALARFVDFSDGNVNSYHRSAIIYVRCVR